MNLIEQAQALAEGHQQVAHEARLWLSWLHVRLDNLRGARAVRRKRARELRELYRLSDRELLDMGLSRSDFPAIAKGTYRRE
jgi:uncharacterized protein YjiS (DUF1127 family)